MSIDVTEALFQSRRDRTVRELARRVRVVPPGPAGPGSRRGSALTGNQFEDARTR